MTGKARTLSISAAPDSISYGTQLSYRSNVSWIRMVDELDDAALIAVVEDLVKNTRIHEIENIAFYDYLCRNDPALIEGMNSFLETANKTQHARQSFSRRNSKRFSIASKSRISFASASSRTSVSVSAVSDKLALTSRLSGKQKAELITKETEILQANMEEFNAKHHVRKVKLLTILEEMEMRNDNIQDTINTFNKTFFPDNPNDEIQNEPFKLMRFIDDWYKRARTTIDKLRLRTSSLKVKYFKLCNQLQQKQLLGKDLQEVDFEYLHIDNRHLVVDNEKKLKLLIELKQMNAKVNLTLSRQKEILIKKMKELADKKEQLAYKEKKLVEFDEECEKLSDELDKTKNEHDRAMDRLEIYEPPDVMKYLRNKAEIDVLKKNIKIWKRRIQIKDMSLNSCLREMKAFRNDLKNESDFVMNIAQKDWSLTPQDI